MNTTPFTYLIGWSKQRIFYFGVRYARGCNPSDLWTTYFTSSGPVKRFRATHGEPDIISVRRVFDSPKAARDWELKVLRRMKVVVREDFLNQHDSPTPTTRGLKLGPRPQIVKEKISRSNKGRKNVHTADSKSKISASLTGKQRSISHCLALSTAKIGKKIGHIDRISYTAVSPTGEEHAVTGRLEAFCSAHGLNRKSMYNTLKSGKPISFGKSTGWKLITTPSCST